MIDESLARCALINLDNFEKQFPEVKFLVFFGIAKAQLQEALGDKGAIDRLHARVEKERILRSVPVFQGTKEMQ